MNNTLNNLSYLLQALNNLSNMSNTLDNFSSRLHNFVKGVRLQLECSALDLNQIPSALCLAWHVYFHKQLWKGSDWPGAAGEALARSLIGRPGERWLCSGWRALGPNRSLFGQLTSRYKTCGLGNKIRCKQDYLNFCSPIV